MPVRAALCCLALCLVTRGALAESCRPAEMRTLGPGAYLRAGEPGPAFRQPNLANAGLIVGERCAAVIDSGGSPEEGEALLCALRELSDRPPCYLILTHHHPDHVLGALAFQRAGVKTVGHARLSSALDNNREFYRQRFAENGVELDPAAVVLPELEVEPGEPLSLDLGGRRLLLTAHPPAHTDNDLSVYDPSAATLWLGDLLFLDHIPVLEAGSRGWLEQLTELRRQPAARAVPGHGPVTAWPDAAASTERYLRGLRSAVRRLLDDGATLEDAYRQAERHPTGGWQLADEFHKRNFGRVFAEMEWE